MVVPDIPRPKTLRLPIRRRERPLLRLFLALFAAPVFCVYAVFFVLTIMVALNAEPDWDRIFALVMAPISAAKLFLGFFTKPGFLLFIFGVIWSGIVLFGLPTHFLLRSLGIDQYSAYIVFGGICGPIHWMLLSLLFAGGAGIAGGAITGIFGAIVAAIVRAVVGPLPSERVLT